MCTRGHWRPEEDEKLKELVARFGPQNWNAIAERLQGRSGKSCRLRWFNQLDPRINRRPFTKDEEERLLTSHRIHGNRWSAIARLFPGRTDNAVKNHFHVIMARRSRERSRFQLKKTSHNTKKDEESKRGRERRADSQNIALLIEKYCRRNEGPNDLSSNIHGHFPKLIGDTPNSSIKFYDFLQVINTDPNDMMECSKRKEDRVEDERHLSKACAQFIDFLAVGS